MERLFFKIILSCTLSASINSVGYGTPSPVRHFPRGCEITDFVFYQNTLVINRNGKQTFYLLHNISDQDIKLEHLQTEQLSPSLSIDLTPGQWAAFATDIQDLGFQCLAKEKDQIQLVDCGNYLEICQYPRVKFSLSNQGNYWVSINASQEQVISDSIKQGIYLKW